MKKIITGFVLAGLLVSCGGDGAPGSDMFGTVMLTTSVEKSVLDIDLVEPRLDNNQCVLNYSTNYEVQRVLFKVEKKPNIPAGVSPSSVYIYQSVIKLQPATDFNEPFNRCILPNITHPSISISVNADSSTNVEIPLVNQDIKRCLVENYGTPNQTCNAVQFDFGNQKSVYKVYAVLSFKAKEINTGIEKSFEVNLGTLNLSDFPTSGGQR